ncbi:MAG: DUF1934 domain-containing protein [Eubacterium sp.]
MGKILLEIVGTQRIDSQKDKTELTTVGSIEFLDDAYIVRYTEEQEPPLAPIEVTVTVSKDEKSVEMTRTGPFSSHLVIEKSKRNLCSYGTQYGDILMGIAGHNIETQISSNEGKFCFSYDIDINGALASKNEVSMTYKHQE